METKKEYTERKEKAGILNEKLRELSEEELEQVTGGMRNTGEALSEMLEGANIDKERVNIDIDKLREDVMKGNIANTSFHSDRRGALGTRDKFEIDFFGK